jgi:hypothetical protein
MTWLVILLILVFPVSSLADTHTAANCSYADISSAISDATAGDTVNVNAEECTWTSGQRLVITKGIQLIGGVGGTYTTIHGRLTYSSGSDYAEAHYLFSYTPDATNRSADTPFRLSGFRLDGNSTSGLYTIQNPYYATPLTKIRIDHCYFEKPKWLITMPYGVVYGVVDNCTFDMATSGLDNDSIDGYGLGNTSWQYLSYTLGTSDNLYYEDCTWTGPSDWVGDNWDCSNAWRYAVRFSTITHVSGGKGSPIFDMHGNEANSTQSCMGVELYRNNITASNTTFLYQPRGGMSAAWDNVVSSSGTSVGLVQANDYGNSQNTNGCDNLSSYPVGPTGNPQHMWGSYFFNNTATSDGIGVKRWGVDYNLGYNASSGCGADGCCGAYDPPSCPTCYNRVVPTAEMDFWGQYPAGGGALETFTGARGIGRGTAAQFATMKASYPTCTTGVAYWVTDEGSWNTSTAGMQGYGTGNGVLYKCTSTNNWELYYTPYAYPHPLRGESLAPATPSEITVIYD